MLIGPPGSGKGTQARMLQEKHGFEVIRTGTYLREMAAGSGPESAALRAIMDNGDLAPPPMVTRMIINKLAETLKKAGKVVFDGSPRTLYEAELLYEAIERMKVKNAYVIYFGNLDQRETRERVSKRYFCDKCAKPYVSVSEKCPVCGGAMKRRRDDDPEAHENRWEEFDFRTRPVVSYFRRKKMVIDIDAKGTIEEVAARVEKAVAGIARSD